MIVHLIVAVAILLTLPLIARRPEYPLAAAIVFSLARDLPGAELLSIVCTIVATGQVIALGHPHMTRRTISRMLPLAILGVVMALSLAWPTGSSYVPEQGVPSWVIAAGNIILALTTARFCAVASSRRQFERALGYISLFFLVFVVPVSNGTDLRLEGFTGNPNRLVLTLAILFPFAYCVTFRFPGPFPKFLLLAWVGFLTAMTLSSQGLIAIPLSVVLSMYSLRRLDASAHHTFFARAGGGIAIVLTLTYLWSSMGGDFLEKATSLAGRDTIFSEAWAVFSTAPVFGTGSRSVLGGGEYLATHNSYLGIMVLGGTVALLPLIIVALQLGLVAWNLRRVNSLVLPLIVAIGVEATVQSLDLVPAVWALLAYVLSHPQLERDISADDELDRDHARAPL